MKVSEFLIELVKVSEKAADLARIVRSEEALFALLVEEKTGGEQNKRFVRDFKTLADVLVQETVRHDLGVKFDKLKEKIRGEESNHFENTLGESIIISVQATEGETAKHLATVLDNNEKAAALLAKVVHEKVTLDEVSIEKILTDSCSSTTLYDDIAEDSVGIWIDPIDSTAQYIQGGNDLDPSLTGIHNEGLRCVVVLIGAYDLTTGLPIAGVVNQPFVQQDPASGRWTGRYVWGTVQGSRCSVNTYIPPHDGRPNHLTSTTSVVISSSESNDILSRLRATGRYQLINAAGAGYKLLNVIDRLACCYLITKGSTYKWDVCAPHAILRALGGGIVDFGKAFDTIEQNRDADDKSLVSLMDGCQILYNGEDPCEGGEGVEKWSNARGLVAYRDVLVLVDLLRALL